MLFPLHGICYEKRINSPEIHNRGELIQCNLFSNEETTKIYNAASIMEDLYSDGNRLYNAEKAFEEFLIALNSLQSPNAYSLEDVNRKIANYFVEFYCFLSHWERHISDLQKEQQYYKDSYSQLYKSATKQAYDHCEEYVLAYAIRNYVSHGYDASSHYHIDGKNNRVYLHRDRLFKINLSASSKEVIKKQPESIDLLNVADKSLNELRNIQSQLFAFRINQEIRDSMPILLEAKSRIDNAGLVSNNWLIIYSVTPKNVIVGQQKIMGSDLTYRQLKWPLYLSISEYIKQIDDEKYCDHLIKQYGINC